MTTTEKTHLDYVIRRHYAGNEMALAKEAWIRTHPALIEAKKRSVHYQGEADLVAVILNEMWEGVHEDGTYPMPDEGNVLPKVEVRDRGREARLVAAKRQQEDDRCALRVALKAAIGKYGVKVPDRVQGNNNSEDALDETFGHLLAAQDQLLFQLHEKYGTSRDSTFKGPIFACDAVMDGEKPQLEVTLFVPPGGVEVPSVFCDFPVTVVEGKKSESKEDVGADESFPNEEYE